MRYRAMGASTGVALFCLAFCGAGCVASVEPDSETAERHQILTVRQMSPYIAEYLEIDQLGPASPRDANLFIGADPADLTRSVQGPGPEGARFIDWDDLAGDAVNHRITDLTDADGVDLTSFPRASECVGPSRVLSKMDLVQALVANNRHYAYFAVLRANNNGNAGYYWLLTRQAPQLARGDAPCAASEDRLTYDVSGPDSLSGALGDVLLVGHFKPGTEPLMEVYRATRGAKGIPAGEAVDYTSDLWVPDPTGVAAVAVNTTVTAPGEFGATGVKAVTPEGHLEAGVFAEAAIPMTVLAGRNPCGKSFYASVLSRSSGAGGPSPDLKDLLGPALFHFGRIQAQATLTPSCRQEFEYTVTATGPSGEPIDGLSCYWEFDTGEVSTSCAGVQASAIGARKASVMVTEPVSGCFETVATRPVSVHRPLSVRARATATCRSTFEFTSEVTGGSNPMGAQHAWRFFSTTPGLGSASPRSASLGTGQAQVWPAGILYTAELTITDARQDIHCEASDFVEVRPFAPLKIHLEPEPFVAECAPDDHIGFVARAKGGQPPYHFAWLGDSVCDDSPLCKVDAPEAYCVEKTIQADLYDSSGLCAPARSKRWVYGKRTTLSVFPKDDGRR